MIFLGLGSNVGDKTTNIDHALSLLSKQGIQIIRCSSYYLTPPWGITDQDEFINIVCEVKYEGNALDLLTICLGTEINMGRERILKWGPRLIDIDILEFHRQQINTPDLKVPHPYYMERDFVLVPLAELEPEWIPTGRLRSLKEYMEDIDISKCERLADRPSLSTLNSFHR